MLAFLAARAVEGVERVEGERYQRLLPSGWIEVAHLPEDSCLVVTGSDPEASVTGARALFDLDADVAAIGA
ncbi:MAG TPA: AlkA N-terminal domain-containing protein, partial [Candidatus Polarisedimenticolaceae bacterium]|nr:AlkA N-terminal domain-containing protein [Candidatus Polarisedimenticolaceae bacterium]